MVNLIFTLLYRLSRVVSKFLIFISSSKVVCCFELLDRNIVRNSLKTSYL